MLIDLTKELDTEHRRLIDSLMFSSVFLRAGYPYSYQNQEIKFSRSVLKIPSKTNNGLNDYYIIDSNVLGKGDFATVHNIPFILTPHFNGFIRREVPLVVKIQKTDDTTFDRVYQEYQCCKHIPHLGMMPPVLSGFNIFTVMNKIEGITLKSYLLKGLSDTEKEQLILRIKQAYITQVVDFQISHNDIHDENILINEETGAVYFIDYSNPEPRNNNNQKKDERQLAALFDRISQSITQEQSLLALH